MRFWVYRGHTHLALMYGAGPGGDRDQMTVARFMDVSFRTPGGKRALLELQEACDTLNEIGAAPEAGAIGRPPLRVAT